jgi:UDP-xylose:glucoside alpha-1,3-xylosyltransferase
VPGRQLCYAVYRATFPTQNTVTWTNLFHPCASQRLFLADALPHVRQIIYVDTDTIFLHPVAQLWTHFNAFSDENLSGLVREAEAEDQGGYRVFATHPYPPPAGLNSGVFLMHLDRLRRIPWMCMMSRILEVYAKDIKYGDQDILNIFFYYQPKAFYTLPCSFNYRTDNCPYSCTDVPQNGVAILHASRGMLRRDSEIHPFKSVVQVIASSDIKKKR